MNNIPANYGVPVLGGEQPVHGSKTEAHEEEKKIGNNEPFGWFRIANGKASVVKTEGSCPKELEIKSFM